VNKRILPIALAGIWISVSEFIRNELLFKSYWVEHFHFLGLKFVTLPINGVFWVIWSFILAYVVFKLSQKFSFKETLFIAWLTTFLMMWITIYNLQVLPIKLLVVALPLSVTEVFIAGFIVKKLT